MEYELNGRYYHVFKWSSVETTILESPQDNGWMFFITPSKFLNHDPLLSMEEYQQFIRTKEAGSAQ